MNCFNFGIILLFLTEVENFLDEDECDLLVDIAKAKKLTPISNRFADMTFKNADQMFKDWDYDEDGLITKEEVGKIHTIYALNYCQGKSCKPAVSKLNNVGHESYSSQESNVDIEKKNSALIMLVLC